MKYKIERDVPFTRVGRPSMYPYKFMEVGDSFFVPGLTRFNAQSWERTTGFQFRQSYREEAGVSGSRVWRIK